MRTSCDSVGNNFHIRTAIDTKGGEVDAWHGDDQNIVLAKKGQKCDIEALRGCCVCLCNC